jgi:hypothetical protein
MLILKNSFALKLCKCVFVSKVLISKGLRLEEASLESKTPTWRLALPGRKHNDGSDGNDFSRDEERACLTGEDGFLFR